VLVRVLFAHALVAAPRLALGWLSPVAPLLGDPRVGMTAVFLSLSRVLPDRYPLRGNLDAYVDGEQRLGRLLDLGVIRPRIDALYAWSAAELCVPEVCTLVQDGLPSYAWDSADAAPWNPEPGLGVRAVRRVLPPRRRDG
jgi:hypothetical protein